MTTKRIFYIGLWNGFDSNDNGYNAILLNHCKNKILVVDNINECDILVVGNFINMNEYNIVNSFTKPKIYLITEPVGPWYDIGWKLLRDNTFNCLSGTVSNGILNGNNKSVQCIKFPLYVDSKDYVDTKNSLEKVNEWVKDSVNEYYITHKNFCCLINRHDAGKTRTAIALAMNSINKIHCPSILFNNCSNEELERIGNVEYIKKFIYNICPENFNNCPFKGYITEKLMNACLGGAIPIYTGSFDEIDAKIFNPKRILFYDQNKPETIEEIVKTVKLFQNEPELLKRFYSQPVFLPSAADTIEEMRKKFAGWFDEQV